MPQNEADEFETGIVGTIDDAPGRNMAFLAATVHQSLVIQANLRGCMLLSLEVCGLQEKAEYQTSVCGIYCVRHSGPPNTADVSVNPTLFLGINWR